MSIHFFRTGRASVDLGAIRIGDKPATGMSREQVFDELYNLRVPGIASTMGKQEMLLRFVDWQAEHEDAIAGKSEQPIIETVVDGLLSRRNLKIAAPKNFSGSAFSAHCMPLPRGTACYATVYCGAACLSGAA